MAAAELATGCLVEGVDVACLVELPGGEDCLVELGVEGCLAELAGVEVSLEVLAGVEDCLAELIGVCFVELDVCLDEAEFEDVGVCFAGVKLCFVELTEVAAGVADICLDALGVDKVDCFVDGGGVKDCLLLVELLSGDDVFLVDELDSDEFCRVVLELVEDD